MVILLLSVLAAIAIPNFIDFRTDAKNATTKGALGALRSAISITRAAIALREQSNTTSKYPTAAEMQANSFNGSHPVLSGTAIMDPATGIPKNPWTTTTYPTVFHNSIGGGAPPGNFPCGMGYDSDLLNYFSIGCEMDFQYGWAYIETSGNIWANSTNNGGANSGLCDGTSAVEICY